MGEVEDEIYMECGDSNIETDRSSAQDLIKKFSTPNNTEMLGAGRKPPKPGLKPQLQVNKGSNGSPAVPISLKDVQQLKLKRVQSPPKASIETPSAADPKSGNELSELLKAFRKRSESSADDLDGQKKTEVPSTKSQVPKPDVFPLKSGFTKPPAKVDLPVAKPQRPGSISSELKKALAEHSDSNSQKNVFIKKNETENEMVDVSPKLPPDSGKRKPAPLPKPMGSSKQDSNNNESVVKSTEKTSMKFEIITHKGCKYMAYKLPLVQGMAPRLPLRTADIVLPPQCTGSVSGRAISFIEPTASDEEEEDSSSGPSLPPSLRSLPTPSATSTITSDEFEPQLYVDAESGGAPIAEENPGEDIYEDFEDEIAAAKKKEEEERLKQKKAMKEEKKRKAKEKEEQRKKSEKKEKPKQKDKFKLDGSERVVFTGIAKERIKVGIIQPQILFEKGDEVPVIRTDESINPRGKWLVQLKDPEKYEYVDIKQVDVEKKQEPVNGNDVDEDNFYEGEVYDEACSAVDVIEEDVYEDIGYG